MKHILSVFAVVFACLSSFAEPAGKPLKVLMIGNSFSKSVMIHTPRVAADLGCELDIASLYIPGCPFQRHAKNLSVTNHPYAVSINYHGKTLRHIQPFPEDKILLKRDKKGTVFAAAGNLRDMLAADKWDIVTIQQASPESWRAETYHPHVDKIIAAIRELAPQAEIRVHQTWSYCTGDPRICNRATMGPGKWKIDRAGMFAKLAENYDALARELGVKVIPMGAAVEEFRKRKNITDYQGDVVGHMVEKNGALKGDSIHLNGRGQFLQALVWTGSLFGVDVTKGTYKPGKMEDETAKILRETAAAVCGK